MSTFHEKAATELLEAFVNDPGACEVLSETRRRLRLSDDHPHAFDPSNVDAVGQVFRTTPATWPLEQVAAFTAVHAGLCSGAFLRVAISSRDMKPGPAADKQRAQNAARLADLPTPFRAQVDLNQNAADSDGFLVWNRAIVLEKATGTVYIDSCSRALKTPVPMAVIARAGQAPLEIGSTLPSRTLLHLTNEGAVARWPYGADRVTLLLRSNLFRPTAHCCARKMGNDLVKSRYADPQNEGAPTAARTDRRGVPITSVPGDRHEQH